MNYSLQGRDKCTEDSVRQSCHQLFSLIIVSMFVCAARLMTTPPLLHAKKKKEKKKEKKAADCMTGRVCQDVCYQWLARGGGVSHVPTCPRAATPGLSSSPVGPAGPTSLQASDGVRCRGVQARPACVQDTPLPPPRSVINVWCGLLEMLVSVSSDNDWWNHFDIIGADV